MKPKKSPLRSEGAGASATLSLRIQPRASRNEILFRENGGLKIRLTAPPVDGAANDALVRLLADRLHITRNQVEIIAGHTGRDKVVRISGMNEEDVQRLLIPLKG